jgi:hypothetical protein
MIKLLTKIFVKFQRARLKLAEKTLAGVEYRWEFEMVHTQKNRRWYTKTKARLERVIAIVRYNLGLQEGDES